MEPGLDRHEWETEWAALEPLVVDTPAEAPPELDSLVARMMESRGIPTTLDGGVESAEPEIVAEFIEARRIVHLLEAGSEVGPGDVGAAITGYRSLYEHLLDERRAP